MFSHDTPNIDGQFQYYLESLCRKQEDNKPFIKE